jgi:hypothetical protein
MTEIQKLMHPYDDPSQGSYDDGTSMNRKRCPLLEKRGDLLCTRWLTIPKEIVSHWADITSRVIPALYYVCQPMLSKLRGPFSFKPVPIDVKNLRKAQLKWATTDLLALTNRGNYQNPVKLGNLSLNHG